MERMKSVEKASPAGKQTADTLHAKQAPASLRTEETTPSVVPSTSTVHTPMAGTPQNPLIPLDKVWNLLKNMNLGLSMEQTLALLTATTAPPIVGQTPYISTPQTTMNLTEPNTVPTEHIPEVETGGERETNKGGNAESDMHVETEEQLTDRGRKLKKKVGEGPESVEGVLVDVKDNVAGGKESESSKEMGNIGNLEENEDDYVIGYNLDDNSWESAICVPEDTPEIRVERAFLNALPNFTGGKGREPWGMLNRFQTLCWK